MSVATTGVRIDAFSRVSNSISPRTRLPHVLASTPTCSDTFRLDFEPNTASLTLGPLSHHLDDELSSPSTPAESFRPETTPVSPQGFLASKPMHSDTPRLHFEPNPIISTPGHLSFHPDDDPSSPSMSFQPKMTPMHPRSLSASKTMQCKSVPWVNDPRLPPHTTTCCDPSPQPSPWLRPLLLPQIVTARSHASCLRPLRLVQALENGPKDSTDGPSRVIDPHLRDTTMTHREPTPSNPPMVVCTQRPCHSLAYPPLLSQIANLDTPMHAPSFPPAPLAWRLMQIASPGGCIPPPSTFSRANSPRSMCP